MEGGAGPRWDEARTLRCVVCMHPAMVVFKGYSLCDEHRDEAMKYGEVAGRIL